MLHMKLLSALIIKTCWSLLMEPGLLQLDIKKALKKVKSLYKDIAVSCKYSWQFVYGPWNKIEHYIHMPGAIVCVEEKEMGPVL